LNTTNKPSSNTNEEDVNHSQRILYIIPPFSHTNLPSLGIHILKSISDTLGMSSEIIYLNLVYSTEIGQANYQIITHQMMSLYDQVGERIFANAAYKDIPILGRNSDRLRTSIQASANNTKVLSYSTLQAFAQEAKNWISGQTKNILRSGYDIVAISLGHQQTNCAIALANAVKAYFPSTKVVLGGPGCDGQMANGVLSLSKNIDHVFSGESEYTWKHFLQTNKFRYHKKIINSIPLKTMDDSPFPDYKSFFAQAKRHGIKEEDCWVMYETTRGCWWAANNQCNFCGVNGSRKSYRYKKPAKVLEELKVLFSSNNTRQLRMVDTLMPREYFEKLLPSINESLPDISYFFEQRADLTLGQVLTLKTTGMNFTQVGIESLSTKNLELINKGTTASQNIAFLRYARSVGCVIGWNLLAHIPNDQHSDWMALLDLIPYIHHLVPPLTLRPLEIVRFSPFFENPNQFGISDIIPNQVYEDIYPPYAEIESLSWLFDSQYKSASRDNPDILEQATIAVQEWKNKWCGTRVSKLPKLHISKKGGSMFSLIQGY